jgi:hypothetical protein
MLDGLNISEQWRQARLSMFTSSNIWKLCGEKGFGETGINYIRSRVFESIAKIPSEPEINTESTIHGLVEETWGMRAHMFKMAIDSKRVVTQKLIYGDNPMFGGTPDGIYCINESSDQLSWNVEVWEVKCYQALKHMESLEFENPQDVKAGNRQLYFQLLDNMLNATTLVGQAIFFHPAMPLEEGGLHVVEFRKTQQVGNKYPLVEDLKFLVERKQLALKMFNELRAKRTGVNPSVISH